MLRDHRLSGANWGVDDLVLERFLDASAVAQVRAVGQRAHPARRYVDQPDLLKHLHVQFGSILYPKNAKVTLTQLVRQIAEPIRVT
jgi:hypothetical protein